MSDQIVFSITMTPQGPKMESKLEKRFLLRILAGVCEDLREEVFHEVLSQRESLAKKVKVFGSIPGIKEG